ncbi:hypothetical protein HQ393_10470 [Chitinibacter bivalviorum]|uniref:Uncharacterized protein n=1 Tax=Chitinibacter bivalviorum TaxID=2739434 RepID=A0A7H9BK45_9NEIS|nr:hypothetical protein [Chitinibacter bivalviorum]QLG88628.1 hypothetical protein HQ393_10470 [Chitinibacter bivalviorum]
MITYSNSLEDWLELTALVAQIPDGADLVLTFGEADRAAGLEVGYGRRLLEATIRNGQFYYARQKAAES